MLRIINTNNIIAKLVYHKAVIHVLVAWARCNCLSNIKSCSVFDFGFPDMFHNLGIIGVHVLKTTVCFHNVCKGS